MGMERRGAAFNPRAGMVLWLGAERRGAAPNPCAEMVLRLCPGECEVEGPPRGWSSGWGGEEGSCP